MRKFTCTMSNLIAQFQYNASLAIQDVVLNPKRMAKFLFNDLVRTPVDRAEELPLALPEDEDPLSIVNITGSCVYGKWFKPGVYNKMVSDSALLLHWPTIIEMAPSQFHTYPSHVLLLLCFKHILVRKSPMMVELLERKVRVQYLSEARGVLSSSIEFSHHHRDNKPLSEHELDILNKACAFLSRDTSLVKALRKAFEATFTGMVPTNHYTTMSRLIPYASPAMKGSTSIVYIDRVLSAPHRNLLSPTFKHPSTSAQNGYSPDFYAPNYRPIINELLYAFDFAKYAWGTDDRERQRFQHTYGVAYNKNRKILFIHWEMWLEYRYQNNNNIFIDLGLQEEDMYNADGKPHSYQYLKTVTAGRLHDWLQVDPYYRGILAKPKAAEKSWGLVMSRPGNYEYIFGLKAKPARVDFDVLSFEGLHKRAMTIRAQKDGVRYRSGGRPRGSSNKEKAYPIKSVEYLTIRPGDSYTFNMVCLRNKMYYSTPWSHNLKEIEHLTPGAPGVRQDPATGQIYYSLAVLRNNAKAVKGHPLESEYQDVMLWLSGHDSYTTQTFMKWRKQDLNLSNAPYTAEQEEAIKMYYRPNATKEMLEKLLRACPNRDMNSIRYKAGQIRKEQLAKGHFDLRHLPHRNMTMKLSREIRKAKEKWEREVARERRE